MLKIQEFINCFDRMFEGVRYLKYNLDINGDPFQIDDKTKVWMFSPGPRSDLKDPLVREANQLILDNQNNLLAKAPDYPLIARNPAEMPKTFNLAAHTVCYELVDTTRVVVYNIDGIWYISGPNHPTGLDHLEGMNVLTRTHGEAVKRYLRKKFGSWYDAFRNTSPMMCFVLGFGTPKMESVLPFPEESLVLEDIINLDNGRPLPPAMVDSLSHKLDLPRPAWREVPGLQSVSKKLYNMRTLSPGLLMIDKFGERVMVPNPIYTKVRRARLAGDRINSVHIAGIVQACRDKVDKVALSEAYPCFADMLELLWVCRTNIYHELMTLWNSAHQLTDAEFAKAISHHPIKHLLFEYRKAKIQSLKNAVHDLKPTTVSAYAAERWPKEFDHAKRQLKYHGGKNHGSSEKESDYKGFHYVEEEAGDQETNNQKAGAEEAVGEKENVQGGTGKEEGCIPFTHDGD